MSKTYIGIDNGKSGGIVAIDEHSRVIKKTVMPLITGSGKKKVYDVNAIADYLKQLDPHLVVLERVFCMPTIPRGTAMSLGHCLGMMEGICASLQFPYIIVHPKEWQKTVLKGMDRSDTKVASIQFAKHMWPKVSWTATARSTKMHDGLTDAACLALYGKSTYGLRD